MPDRTTTLTPRQAILFGVMLVAIGAFPILIALGVLHPDGDAPLTIQIAQGIRRLSQLRALRQNPAA